MKSYDITIFKGLIILQKSHPRCPIFPGSDDMYALCLSMLCVANFAAYERKVLAISSSKRLGKHLPIEEMTRDLVPKR